MNCRACNKEIVFLKTDSGEIDPGGQGNNG